MNNDLIRRNALFKSWDGLSDEIKEPDLLIDEMIKRTQDAPAVDAEPVRHGKWIFKIYSYSTPKCSCCGWKMPYSEDSTLDARNYCPNCGAKMDVEVEE